MKSNFEDLEGLQKLVIDIAKIERSHLIPGTERHENVIEHSFAVAWLCWRIFEATRPPLNLEKILKYALIHDFSERGLKSDTNTYASGDERRLKKAREEVEVRKIRDEFKEFTDFANLLDDYEQLGPEALFVWSIDKMHPIILGSIDRWRPYILYGITYEQFFQKGEEFLEKCSPYVRDIFRNVVEESRKTYYDNPAIKNA